MVASVSDWVQQWGLQFGLVKCGWMWFRSAPNTTTAEPLLCLNSAAGEIQRVSEYEYLGTILDERLSFESELASRSKKLNQALAILRPLFRNSRIHPSVKLRVLRSVAIPTALYGCEAWCQHKAQFKKMQREVDRAVMRMLGIRWANTTVGVVRMEVAQRSLYSLARRRQLKTIWRWTDRKLNNWAYSIIQTISFTDARKGPLGSVCSWTLAQLGMSVDKAVSVASQTELLDALDLQEGAADCENDFPVTAAGRWYKAGRYRRDLHYDACPILVAGRDGSQLKGHRMLVQLRTQAFMSVPRLLAAGKVLTTGFDGDKRCLCHTADESAVHILLKCPIYTEYRPRWGDVVRQHCGWILGSLYRDRSAEEKCHLLLGGNFGKLRESESNFVLLFSGHTRPIAGLSGQVIEEVIEFLKKVETTRTLLVQKHRPPKELRRYIRSLKSNS